MEITRPNIMATTIPSPILRAVTFTKYISLPGLALWLEPIITPVIIILTARSTTLDQKLQLW